jgi:ATP-dependent exoDNAse (exonuclease V) alpha subunit
VVVNGVLLTDEQAAAVEGVIEAVKNGYRTTALTGSAGTGKTTCLRALCDKLPNVVLCAPTWRAARIIADKSGLETTTLYSAVMRPEFMKPLPALNRWLESRGEVPHTVKIRWPDTDWDAIEDQQQCYYVLGIRPMDWIKRWVAKDPVPKILVVDEASMLGVEAIAIAQDVYQAIILVGDTKQLEPVKDKPVLHMVPDELTFELTRIHRQAEGSPVLDIAYQAHATGRIDAELEMYSLEHAAAGVPIICWRNAIRLTRTAEVRAMLDYPEYEVVTGEPLVCRSYRRQERDKGLINNTLWTVKECRGRHHLIANDAGEELEVELAMEEFDDARGVPFRFGYCITAHTSQGGEWPVVGIDAKDASVIAHVLKDGAKPWAYTAASRARERVFLVEGVQ